jgi:hypothetical protein
MITENVIVTYKFTTKAVEREGKVYAEIIKSDPNFTTSM